MQVPVFIQFNGYPPHVDSNYQGRVRLVEQASIEITDLRTSDAGWYECSVVFLHDSTDDTDGDNGTWIYLSVYCEHRLLCPRLMGLLRYEHDSTAIRLRFEYDTTSYEELCALEQ